MFEYIKVKWRGVFVTILPLMRKWREWSMFFTLATNHFAISPNGFNAYICAVKCGIKSPKDKMEIKKIKLKLNYCIKYWFQLVWNNVNLSCVNINCLFDIDYWSPNFHHSLLETLVYCECDLIINIKIWRRK